MNTATDEPSKNSLAWEAVETNLIRYRANGIYYAKFKLHGRKTKVSLETDKLAEARRKLSAMLSKVRAGISKGKSSLTMLSLIEEWKAWIKRKVQAPRTTEARLDNLRVIKLTWPNIESARFSQITRYDIESWRDSMVTTHGYSHSQANQCLGTLKQIFRIAEDKGMLLGDAPTTRVKQLRPVSRKIHLPSKEVFERLRNRVYENSPQGGKLFDFLRMTGARIDSARHVKWSDVDWDKGVLHFQKAKRGGYTVELFKPLREFLTEIRPPHAKESDNIFHIESIKKVLHTSCVRLGIKPAISHHSLRHWFATRCIERGVDIPTVSRWLGHRDGGALALRVYGHLRQEHSKQMAELLNED
jgi:integrase